MNSENTIFDALTQAGADSMLIFDVEGKVISAKNVPHENNIAAMMNIIYKMNNDLSSDIEYGEAHQIICKADNGFYIINTIDEERTIAVFLNDISRLGMVLLSLDKVIDN